MELYPTDYDGYLPLFYGEEELVIDLENDVMEDPYKTHRRLSWVVFQLEKIQREQDYFQQQVLQDPAAFWHDYQCSMDALKARVSALGSLLKDCRADMIKREEDLTF